METMRDIRKNTRMTITLEGEDLRDIITAVAGILSDVRHGGPGGRCRCQTSPPDTLNIDEDDDFLSDLLKHFNQHKPNQ